MGSYEEAQHCEESGNGEKEKGRRNQEGNVQHFLEDSWRATSTATSRIELVLSCRSWRHAGHRGCPLSAGHYLIDLHYELFRLSMYIFACYIHDICIAYVICILWKS